MKSILRCILAHPKPAKFILALLVTLLCIYMMDAETFSFGFRFLMAFSLLFSCYTFVNSVSDLLLREPLEKLENGCDPYPLLQEAELQMKHLPDSFQGQMIQINYALALVQTGSYEKALETLEAVDMDKYPNPIAKFIYYNNLCDLMTRLDRYPEADSWYRKSLEMLDSIPNKRLRERLDRTVEMNAIEALYRDQDYSGALRRLARIPCPTPRSVADAALLAARCNLGLEEWDKAKEKLQYIIDNGNRLQCVTEAKALMDTLA
jgi:tetratricopeptide (TPR) repeat protein